MSLDAKTARAQELAGLLIQFKRLSSQNFAGQAIRQSEFQLLVTLLAADAKDVKVSDLSAQLQITPPAVTHIINSLEDGGYVERLADATDRRLVLVKLTERGKHVIAAVREKFLETLKDLLGVLGERDSQEFLRLLAAAVAYFKERQNTA